MRNMKILNRKEPLILLLGDLFFFIISLWLALFLRYFQAPSNQLFFTHIVPFLILFVVWIIVFYIAGLYEKHTVILKSRLPNTLINTQIANSGLAVIFFYLVPLFGITPKTILFIYLIVSLVLIIFWRRYGYSFIGTKKPNNAILIGSGEEMKELLEEVNSNPIYSINFVSSVDLDKAEGESFWDEIIERIYAENVSIIAIDLSSDKVEPVLPHLYNLIFSNISFIDMHKFYEEIFDRVPLSLLKYNWFLENISTQPRVAYDTLKRLMDIFISLVLLVVSIIFYPFIILAIKLDDGGSIFSFQTRVGENNKLMKIMKFRTMTIADDKAGISGTGEALHRRDSLLQCTPPYQTGPVGLGANIRRTSPPRHRCLQDQEQALV